MCDYKAAIFDAIMLNLNGKFEVNMAIFEYNVDAFIRIIQESLNNYEYFIIMPHFRRGKLYGLDEEDEDRIRKILDCIPASKLYYLENYLPHSHRINGALLDYSEDFYKALTQASGKITLYEKIIFVNSSNSQFPLPTGIIDGFVNYCDSCEIDYEIVNDCRQDFQNTNGTLLMIFDENDLAACIKAMRKEQKEMGRDVGIISYNDHPMKDLLGISTITADFFAMGASVGKMISEGIQQRRKMHLEFIDRGSA